MIYIILFALGALMPPIVVAGYSFLTWENQLGHNKAALFRMSVACGVFFEIIGLLSMAGK